jgi:2-succinyl-6-hydroxy-2,4-cyclohexadiene-1-carboxylate synthase
MRMMLVPGFSQPASTWNAVLASLHPSIDATALDVPDDLDFGASAAAIATRGGHAVYVGYSMGGRLALHLALDRPDLVAGLVLVSASPGIADPVARAERAEADARLAADVEREGVAVFLERWLAQPLFAALSRDEAALDQRIATSSVVGLVHQLTVLGQGAMPDAWARLEELSMPVLLVTGAGDTKYAEIGAEMHRRSPRLEHTTIPGGHALLLEQPLALAERINEFVHELGSATE